MILTQLIVYVTIQQVITKYRNLELEIYPLDC